MEPVDGRGLGSSAGAVAAALIAAAAVLVMVAFGGGINKPLVHPHVEATRVAQGPAAGRG